MDSTDKIRHTVQDLAGKAKEGIGRVTNDPHLKSEGERDQTKSDLGEAKDKAKDALSD